MIDRRFWEEARKAWVVLAPPKIKEIKTGLGGAIDPSLLIDPWELDNTINNDEIIRMSTKDGIVQPQQEQSEIKTSSPKPRLDKKAFDEFMEKQDMPDRKSVV